MSPTIHLVRHGEAEHNVAYDLQIRDPSLTKRGGEQCQALARTFPHMDRMTHLVASPLRRTIQTAHWAFVAAASTATAAEKMPMQQPPKQKKPVTILALGELQECSAYPCDTGLPVEALMATCGGLLDLSRVEAGWNSKRGLYAVTESAIRRRAGRARNILRELASAGVGGDNDENDAHIVVVSHGTMLQYLIDRGDDDDDIAREHFRNCEYRSYKFVDLHGNDPETAGLVETNESFYRRKGPLISRSPQELIDLVAAELCSR